MALALDPTSVYWTNGRGSVGIQRTPKAGGATTVLTEAPSTGASLVADETGVYWANSQGIMKRRAAGGDPLIIAADVRPARLALDGTRIYWGDGFGTVKSAPREGGPPTVHGGVNARAISALAVDGQHVYWAADGQLWRSPKQPPIGSQLLARDAWIGHIAVDDRAVYWLTETALRKLPKDADTASSLALHLMRARGLTLDGCHAYFTTNELSRPGQLWKVRR